MNWKLVDFNWNPFLSIDLFEVQKENQLKVDSNELKVSWFQLKVDSNELKVSWFQLKSFLINRSLWGSKGKSIESRFKWIESKLISIESRFK